jgi:acyl-CoA thioester hydrolase
MKKYRAKIHVRYADIDVMGHVNNAIYLNYFEESRVQWFKQITSKEWDWVEHGIILARNEVDYISPVLFNDEVFIDVTCEKIGNKSMTLNYEVFAKRKDKEILCAKGLSVLVSFNFKLQQTTPIPEEWKQALIES